jgi:hypothetical protein
MNMFDILGSDSETEIVNKSKEVAQNIETKADSDVSDWEDETETTEEPVVLQVTPFKEVVPVPTQFDDEEFPALGSVAPPKKSKGAKRRERRDRSNARKGTPITFIVASSRIQELRAERYGSRPGSDKRTQAFARLQDKETIAKSLQGTKACRHVLKDKGDGKVAEDFGVCYREHCTFAHSLADLKLPPCAFGNDCNRRNGTYNRKTRKVDKSKKCQFCHDDEQPAAFYKRTGRKAPDLPETSEKSRQPKPRKTKTPKKQQQVATKVVAAPLQPQLIRHDSSIVGDAKVTQPLHINKWNPVEEDNEDNVSVTSTTAVNEEETVIIRVPASMADKALEMAFSRGLTKFEIITT